MKTSRINTDIAQRIKQVIVLFILVIAGIIVTLSAEAKPATSKIHDRYHVVKKHNKMYSHAWPLRKVKKSKHHKVKAPKASHR